MRPVPVGAAADTPASLRRKAAEFRRLAAGAATAEMRGELLALAEDYMRRAVELEVAEMAAAANDPTQAPGEME